MNDHFRKLQTLLLSFSGQDDIIADENQPDLRLNLRPETIDLWGATYDQKSNSGDNLLLACSSSRGPIEDTSITWVVGSAIRSVHAGNQEEFRHLMQAVGLTPELAESVLRHCPGIADGAVWALYYERHGHLVATPVLTAGLGLEVAASISSMPV